MSLDGLLLETWSVMRPIWAQRPSTGNSLLDFALSGADTPLQLPASFGNQMQWIGPIPAEPPRPTPPEAAASTATPTGPTPLAVKLPRSSGRAAPHAEDVKDRNRSLDAWCVISDAMGPAFHMVMKMGGKLDREGAEVLFAAKASGTLAVRASAWNLFLRYCKEVGSEPAMLDEEAAHGYLEHLRAKGLSASRGDSFLRACNFALGICGFNRGLEIHSSARCRGAAALSLKDKKEWRQRNPLKVLWIEAAEKEVVDVAEGAGSFSKPEAELLGFFLFTTHTRSRCSDAARITSEPTLDEAEGSHAALASFIEASSLGEATKTGAAKRAKLAVPVVGLSLGVSATPWARSWLRIRASLGMDARSDGCLQLELFADGSFGSGRIKPGQATEWLRALLLKLGACPEELVNIGSHSCKVTLLSIAAKAGLNRDDRRTLGGHAAPNDKSVDIYSRDCLAAPLLELAKLLEDIRRGFFDPDSSRSGRWSRFQVREKTRDPADLTCCFCKGTIAGARAFLCECGRLTHCKEECNQQCPRCSSDFCRFCDGLAHHKCSEANVVAPILVNSGDLSEQESDDDSDLEVARMTLEADGKVEQDAEDQALFLKKGFSDGSDAQMPPEGVVVHRVYRTAHKSTEDCEAACGIATSDVTFEYTIDPADLFKCKLCWRPGCAPWVRLQTEAAASDNEFVVPEGCIFDEPQAPSPAPTPYRSPRRYSPDGFSQS